MRNSEICTRDICKHSHDELTAKVMHVKDKVNEDSQHAHSPAANSDESMILQQACVVVGDTYFWSLLEISLSRERLDL